MKINRNNYEEYFILYMDNELSSDERRQVEAFVVLHPDLKEELDLLLQYKLAPDASVVFDGKEELMKQEYSSAIALNNYEEWMLLYLDRELNNDRQKELEMFMLNNPQLKNDFLLLQKTKLEAEEIVFADKASLYRHTEKARVVTFNWRRVAVAAIFIIGLSTAAFLVFDDSNKGGKDVAGKQTNTQTEKTADAPAITKETDAKKDVPVIANAAGLSPEETKKEINPVTAKKNPGIKNKIQQPDVPPVQIKKEDPVIVDNNNPKPSNNLPQPINTFRNINDATNAGTANAAVPDKVIATEVTNPTVEPSDNKNPAVMYASLEEGGSNKKSRGFFRKITRTFQKRTNTNASDDDRLLVAGLSIKLK